MIKFVFHQMFYRISLVFAAVRPTAWLLFTILSWGASFFAKLGKYQPHTPKKLPKFAEPTAQGVLDPPASPVFVYYSTIFFDGPPWGIRWRKCDPRSSADAPPTLPRRSVDAPPMFPEASKNRAKKTLIFGCLFGSILAPFGLQIRSILASLFASVFEQVFEAFFLDFGGISDPPNIQFWCSRAGAVGFFEFSPCR